jgi:hypothetical protein
MRANFNQEGRERERRYGTFSLQHFDEGQPEAGLEDFLRLAKMESLRERLQRGSMARGKAMGARKPYGD